MPATPANPRTFALLNPEVFVAFHTEPGREILSNDLFYEWNRRGNLGPALIAQAIEELDADLDRSPGAGAFAWEVFRVPNGTFQFRAPGYGDQDIQIHTVQRGSLKGRRVVKVRDDAGPGGWRAIAFVGRHGTFQLWTRYLSLAEEASTIAARAVVEAMFHTRGLGGSFNVPSRTIEGVPVQAVIAVTRISCRVCNESVLDGQIELVPGRLVNNPGLCDMHLPALPVTRRVIPSVDRAEEMARIREENAANAPAAPQRASRGRSEATYGDERFVVRRRTDLVMCEITGTEIQ